jgi:DNA-directed RNA polymerase specialized sigma24 family protein
MLKMLGTTNQTMRSAATTQRKEYASRADFCQIFEADIDRLYLLAFLLTADHALAEKCFVQGLEDSKNGNLVFKEWAQSWARRSIITDAIRKIHPRPQLARPESAVRADEPATLVQGSAAEAVSAAAGITPQERGSRATRVFHKEIAAIVALPAFQRFAFVISVLEGYSNRETSLLLDCSLHELVSARTHALQQIGDRPELPHKLAGIDATKASLTAAGAAYTRELLAHLAPA